jgi:serine/threonine protein kinase
VAKSRYAQLGDLSPMVDVYSFGVVLFELLSGKKAIIQGGDVSSSNTASSVDPQNQDQKSLVALVCDKLLLCCYMLHFITLWSSFCSSCSCMYPGFYSAHLPPNLMMPWDFETVSTLFTLMIMMGHHFGPGKYDIVPVRFGMDLKCGLCCTYKIRSLHNFVF